MKQFKQFLLEQRKFLNESSQKQMYKKFEAVAKKHMGKDYNYMEIFDESGDGDWVLQAREDQKSFKPSEKVLGQIAKEMTQLIRGTQYKGVHVEKGSFPSVVLSLD